MSKLRHTGELLDDSGTTSVKQVHIYADMLNHQEEAIKKSNVKSRAEVSLWLMILACPAQPLLLFLWQMCIGHIWALCSVDQVMFSSNENYVVE